MIDEKQYQIVKTIQNGVGIEMFVIFGQGEDSMPQFGEQQLAPHVRMPLETSIGGSHGFGVCCTPHVVGYTLKNLYSRVAEEWNRAEFVLDEIRSQTGLELRV